MIEVNNLVKKYGGHLAVDHISFEIKPGTIYGFLGPNGAGKSTIMNIMTGYIAPTQGSVKVNGHDIVKEAEEAKKCIGYLPEIPPLYQDMTVREYLSFAAQIKKSLPRKEQKGQIQEVMEQTMIADMADRLIKNLSKGYKQRVGLAQAMLGYPEVIILDEPTVGLDPKQIIEIRDLIKKLGEKHTVILSSHILSEVQAVCDEIMIISKGKLVASDTPEGLMGLMNGSTSLDIHIKGNVEAVRELLDSFAEISEYTIEESAQEGCVKVLAQVCAGEDIREALFYKLAEYNMPIMLLNRREKSLEDVFLELTQVNDPLVDAKDFEESEENENPEAVDAAYLEEMEESQEVLGGNNDDGNL